MRTQLSSIVVALLLTASAAAAQDGVTLTNADLGQKRPQAFTVSPETLDGLRARQYVYVPRHYGPTAIVVPSRASVRGDALPELPPTAPLDPNWTPPAPFNPFYGDLYGGMGYGGYGRGGRHAGAGVRRSFSRAAAPVAKSVQAPIAPPVASPRMSAAGAGVRRPQ